MVSEEFWNTMSALSEAIQTESARYEQEVDAWWNQLSKEDRERAFYAVVSRIHKGEMVDRGSYRYVLYDIFGFDVSMYSRGMDCGYMALHNAIVVSEGEGPID